MKKKIVFIINPISGIKKANNLEKIINTELNQEIFNILIKHTEYAGHAKEITKWAVSNKYDIVVAVGGDGTINEISSELINTNTSLAIIPKGSGNGFARFLKIPLNINKAVKLINKMSIFTIDTIKLNEFYYVNMAGVGFDAHIAHLFAEYGKRGLKSYIELIFKEFKTYKSINYELKIDGTIINLPAFLISFANSSQFGNNAHIAPLADISDGLIDVCILNNFPKYKAIAIIWQLYTKRLIKSKYYKLYKAKKIEITSNNELSIHIDGDPIKPVNKLNISILPKSLKVIC